MITKTYDELPLEGDDDDLIESLKEHVDGVLQGVNEHVHGVLQGVNGRADGVLKGRVDGRVDGVSQDDEDCAEDVPMLRS